MLPVGGVNDCPVCGGGDYAVYYGGDPTLVRCRGCRFVRQHPYIEVEYASYYNLEWAAQQEWQYPKRHRALGDIADRILAAGGAGRLLDVGAGDGQFHDICRLRGFDVVGVEPSSVLAEHGRRKGLDIRSEYYGDDVFPPNSFDVVCFVQVLEHIPQPVPMLLAAHRHLRVGGSICIEVPSRTAPHFLLYQATKIKALIDPPRGVLTSHVGYHHPASVRRLAATAGFVEISLTTGRWAAKYDGWKRAIGGAVDPLANMLRVGGILYLGRT